MMDCTMHIRNMLLHPEVDQVNQRPKSVPCMGVKVEYSSNLSAANSDYLGFPQIISHNRVDMAIIAVQEGKRCDVGSRVWGPEHFQTKYRSDGWQRHL